ncbi:MAG: hypothetical protein QXP55_04270 [Nitrososphaerales archaeon]
MFRIPDDIRENAFGFSCETEKASSAALLIESFHNRKPSLLTI